MGLVGNGLFQGFTSNMENLMAGILHLACQRMVANEAEGRECTENAPGGQGMGAKAIGFKSPLFSEIMRMPELSVICVG